MRRRTLQAIAALAVLVAIVLLTPGLGEVRDSLADANPAWLALATLLEGLSFASYVVMFGPIFCTGLSWRRCWQIGGAELAMGSLIPASGAGGLALGAWVLHRGGMDGERIARRSVAFFLIKSGVNFLAVAVLGAVMALGLVGPELSLWLTAFPAAVATLALAAVVVDSPPRPGPPPGPGGLTASARGQRGAAGADRRQRRGAPDPPHGEPSRARGIGRLLGLRQRGALGDVPRRRPFPPLTVILMGYLIGQLGGLLPIPGGIGGIDGGLIGTLIVYGAPAAGTAAAVLGYRVILFWLPLILGGIAFAALRRDMPGSYELAACAPAIAAQSA